LTLPPYEPIPPPSFFGEKGTQVFVRSDGLFLRYHPCWDTPLGALLRDLARRTPVDQTRVYATGHSNGAMMSYRLTAEMPDRIAAIAPVAGSMVVSSPNPRRPVAMLHVHSVDDPRALYDGGLGPPFPLTRSRVLHPSVSRTIRWWVQHNGCPAQPREGELLRGTPGSKEAAHTAQRFVYGPRREGTEVALLRLTGAGHGWPGGTSILSERIVGPATSVIDASEELWGPSFVASLDPTPRP
jgi:polyhydroxybutyrate depolymerase